MAQAPRDQNYVTALLLESSTAAGTTVSAKGDQVTGRLLVDNSGGGSGTVTTVSVVSANGFAGTVANATTTPAITLSTSINSPVLAGNGTAIAAATTTGSGSTVMLNTAPTITNSLTLGAASGSTGSVIFKGTTSGTVTLSVADAAGTWTMKLPTSAGGNTNLLQTDGSGNTSWVAAPAASLVVGTTTISSGTNTRILYDNSGVLGEYTITGTGTVVAMQTNPTLSGLTMTDATNIVLNTTTGTKIGTATTQKLGFYNATPIVQPTGDVITALQNLGLGATLTVAATTITSRTLWGQTYDGSANVSGSLTAVGNITGGASSMTITAGTGASRTLALQSTTSGSSAATFLTGNADQTTTFAAGINGTGAWTITGGAGNMTILSGTGASRTMILQTTTAGSTATTALTLGADQSATFAGHLVVEGVTSTGATGTGKFVFDGTPTLVTPVLGVATATSINKVAITAPASSATLTIADGKTLTVSQTMTLTSGGTSSVITFPNATDTVGGLGTSQTWSAQNKFNNIIDVNNPITASSNAATVPVTFRLSTVTNNSAATLTITMTTTSAVDGQMTIVRILDASAAAQTITWVNTENSTVSAPTTSNGSTTAPLTVGFMYNSANSKWRCLASA